MRTASASPQGPRCGGFAAAKTRYASRGRSPSTRARARLSRSSSRYFAVGTRHAPPNHGPGRQRAPRRRGADDEDRIGGENTARQQCRDRERGGDAHLLVPPPGVRGTEAPTAGEPGAPKSWRSHGHSSGTMLTTMSARRRARARARRCHIGLRTRSCRARNGARAPARRRAGENALLMLPDIDDPPVPEHWWQAPRIPRSSCGVVYVAQQSSSASSRNRDVGSVAVLPGSCYPRSCSSDQPGRSSE